MKTIFLISLCAVSVGSSSAQKAPAALPYRLLATVTIGGEGGWDFLSVDPAGERLYVAHGTQVEVLNVKTRKLIGTIPNTPGVHGIEVVPAAGRGYISCGRNNTCVVFDLKTLQPVGTVPTGPKPDALLADAFSKRVFVFSNDGGNSTVLDARTGKVLGTAALGGDVEVPATDGKGRIFVNIENTSEVVTFDAKTLVVQRRTPLAPGQEPTGLAFDPKHERLFSALRQRETGSNRQPQRPAGSRAAHRGRRGRGHLRRCHPEYYNRQRRRGHLHRNPRRRAGPLHRAGQRAHRPRCPHHRPRPQNPPLVHLHRRLRPRARCHPRTPAPPPQHRTGHLPGAGIRVLGE